MPEIKHHKNCTSNYPERSIEPQIQPMSLEPEYPGETVWTCIDCGAFVVEKRDITSREEYDYEDNNFNMFEDETND